MIQTIEILNKITIKNFTFNKNVSIPFHVNSISVLLLLTNTALYQDT